MHEETNKINAKRREGDQKTQAHKERYTCDLPEKIDECEVDDDVVIVECEVDDDPANRNAKTNCDNHIFKNKMLINDSKNIHNKNRKISSNIAIKSGYNRKSKRRLQRRYSGLSRLMRAPCSSRLRLFPIAESHSGGWRGESWHPPVPQCFPEIEKEADIALGMFLNDVDLISDEDVLDEQFSSSLGNPSRSIAASCSFLLPHNDHKTKKTKINNETVKFDTSKTRLRIKLHQKAGGREEVPNSSSFVQPVSAEADQDHVVIPDHNPDHNLALIHSDDLNGLNHNGVITAIPSPEGREIATLEVCLENAMQAFERSSSADMNNMCMFHSPARGLAADRDCDCDCCLEPADVIRVGVNRDRDGTSSDDLNHDHDGVGIESRDLQRKREAEEEQRGENGIVSADVGVQVRDGVDFGVDLEAQVPSADHFNHPKPVTFHDQPSERNAHEVETEIGNFNSKF